MADDPLDPEEELRQRTLGGMLSVLSAAPAPDYMQPRPETTLGASVAATAPDAAKPANTPTLGGMVTQSPGPNTQRLQDLQTQLANKPPASGWRGALGNLASSVPLGRMIEAAVPGSRLNLEQKIAGAQPASDLEQKLAAAATKNREDTARASQQESLATEEQAKATQLLHPTPKPQKGELVFDKAGNAIGYQDETGNLMAPSNASLPADVKEILANAKPKPAAVPEAERTLTDPEIAQVNAGNTRRWQVDHPNTPLPADATLAKGATKNDADRIEKLFTGTETAEATQAQRQQSQQDRDAARAQSGREQDLREMDARDRFIQPYKQSVDTATNADAYVNSGKPTGAGDYALMNEFQEMLTNGQRSGIRFTQNEQNMLTHAQDIRDSTTAYFKHKLEPNAPYFSDDLRQNILDVMKRGAAQAQKQIDDYDAERKTGQGSAAGKGSAAATAAPGKGALTIDDARGYMQRAGGDKDKARQLAKQDGRTF